MKFYSKEGGQLTDPIFNFFSSEEIPRMELKFGGDDLNAIKGLETVQNPFLWRLFSSPNGTSFDEWKLVGQQSR